MFTEDLCQEDLPDSCWQLLSVVGFEAVVVLIERFGGRRLSIPRTIGPHHRLAQALGQDVAQRLCQHLHRLGVYRFEVPKGRSLIAGRLRRAIIQNPDRLSLSELAIRYAVSRSWVKQVRAKARRGTQMPPSVALGNN